MSPLGLRREMVRIYNREALWPCLPEIELEVSLF